MALFDILTWLKLGRPARGAVTSRERLSYPFEEGAELRERLAARFGDLSQLSVVDLGAGPGETFVAKQILETPWRRLVSVEAFLPYVHKLQSKTAKAAQHEIIEAHIGEYLDEMAGEDIDLAFLIDVLEHFSRGDAMRILTRLEKSVKLGIVIFIPLGHVEQDALDQNALQRHRSSWTAAELARLGYTVQVYGGLHGQLDPPADAAWAIKQVGRPKARMCDEADARSDQARQVS